MKKMIFASAILAATQLQAQQVEWSAPVQGDAKTIFFHNFTQTPVLEMENNWVGIDNANHKVAWTIKKSAKNEALKKVSKIDKLTGGKSSEDVAGALVQEDYIEIPNTQFALVSGVIIDIVNGTQVVGSEAAPIKKLLKNQIVPTLNIVLFKVEDADSKVSVHAVDIETDKILWKKVLTDVNKKKNALKGFVKMNGGELPEGSDVFEPSTDPDGNIFYAHERMLYLLDKQTGASKWELECNPGAVIQSKDKKNLYVPERGNTITGKFGKTLHCISAATGKKVWANPLALEGSYFKLIELDNNQIAVVSTSTIMLYNASNAAKVWKKPYGAPFISRVDVLSDGLEVYYGNRIDKVNLSTGKSALGKPIVLEDVDPNTSTLVRKDYDNSYVIFTPTAFAVKNKANNKKKWNFYLSQTDRVAFDDVNKKALAICGKKIYVLDPDNQAKRPSAVEAKLDDADALIGYKLGDKGYFIYGAKEYIMISKDGKVLSQKVYPQLKTGGWARFGLAMASVATGIQGTTVTTADGHTTGLFCDAETAEANANASMALSDLRKEMKSNSKQRVAARSSDDTAIFVTSQKSKGNETVSLVIVDKNSGEEIKTVNFSDDRDVVFEIDFNTNMLYFVDKGVLKAMNLK
jgi:outer membrane protein assembly factor BamB